MTEWLFASGHAADVILGVLIIEAVWLCAFRHWSLSKTMGLLGPAAMIVLGLRAAMVGASWYWIAVPLVLSFPLHLYDLRSRLR